jgi:hypothetical protein
MIEFMQTIFTSALFLTITRFGVRDGFYRD